MRVVIDTNVVVAAIRSPRGASASVLRAVRHQRLSMILGLALWSEYEAKLLGSTHARLAGLNDDDVRAVLTVLAALAHPVEPNFRWRPQVFDADDEMVLETAINGNADAIVTFNIRDFGDAPQRFGIALLTPSELLERMKT